MESAKVESLQGRVADLGQSMITLKQNLAHLENKLAEAKGKLVGISAIETTNETTNINPVKQLTELLEIDTDLRDSRQAMSSLESNVFSISELIRLLRNEISGCLTDDVDSRTSINELLGICDGLEEDVNRVLLTLLGSSEFWKNHDATLKTRWNAILNLMMSSQSASSTPSGKYLSFFYHILFSHHIYSRF